MPVEYSEPFGHLLPVHAEIVDGLVGGEMAVAPPDTGKTPSKLPEQGRDTRSIWLPVFGTTDREPRLESFNPGFLYPNFGYRQLQIQEFCPIRAAGGW